jgi:ERF superfamily
MKSDQINELASALAKAQAKIKGAVKDSANPFFKSSYADLQSVWDAIREPLSSNGLAVIQTTATNPAGGLDLVTTLAHSSGQWIEGRFPILPLKNEPQAVGSATSYARRYSLASIVGVYQTDDDGEQAQARPYVSKHDSKPAPHPGQLKPVSAPAPVAATPAPQVDPKPATEENKTPAAAKKPYFDKIKTSAWTKEQLGTYAKMYFGKSDANALTLNELMNFSNTVTTKTFDEVFNFGEEKI